VEQISRWDPRFRGKDDWLRVFCASVVKKGRCAMEQRVAIVTGGLRGLGKAMALGLAREGHRVLAVGHIAEDVPAVESETAGTPLAGRLRPLVADPRRAEECDRLLAAAERDLGPIDILVNNAGLTFTYIDPPRFRRPTIQRFWEVGDEIVENVIATNYLAGDRLARRVAPGMVARGWGRIVNVTTKLDTMNRAGTHPYGASKAALELATEVWAKETQGTGLTINIVNPGAGANTPGMADEMRRMSRDGQAPRLVEPGEMVPSLLYVVSREADRVNGRRFDANLWDASLPPAAPAARPGSRCTRQICADGS
jgi:3-oxoacyl-[acyl-carrier protein] reductase